MEHLGLEFQSNIEQNFDLIKDKFNGLDAVNKSLTKANDELLLETNELRSKLAPTE